MTSQHFQNSWIFVIFIFIAPATLGEIRIGFLPTFSNKKLLSDSVPTKYDVGAIECAIRDLNQISRSRQAHNLTYIYNDTRGDQLLTIQTMTSQLQEGVHAFVGFESSCETEARVAAAWNVPIVTYVSPTPRDVT